MNKRIIRKIFPLIIFIIFIFSNIIYARDSFVIDNTSYDIPGKGELTENIVKNLSYKIHLYGSMIEGTYKDNPPLSLTEFKNGFYEPQDGKIRNIAFGKIDNNEQNSAAVYFFIFDGGNNVEHYLAIITPQGDKYHITQAVLDYAKMNVKKVQIKNGKILLNILSHGPNDPGCCPSVKETISFKIEKDRLKKI